MNVESGDQVFEEEQGVLSLRLTVEGCRDLDRKEKERIQEAMLECLNEVSNELVCGDVVKTVFVPLADVP